MIKEKLKNAINEVTGITPAEMTSKNRTSAIVNAKCIFAFHASQFMTAQGIARYLRVSKRSVYSYVNLYKKKYEHQAFFKKMANEIIVQLNK